MKIMTAYPGLRSMHQGASKAFLLASYSDQAVERCH
jgi:hypothetical protein